MNRLEKAFENKKAFIPFITCGDPNLHTTKEIIKEMINKGADIIELGIPFSDPTAEGPVIQAASLRALNEGTTPDKIFDMLTELKNEGINQVPFVFMTYANLVFSYGIDRFGKRCRECGVEGLVLPDVPYEEKSEFEDVLDKNDVTLIALIAPTSKERAVKIAREAKGYIYLVSSMGVTGKRDKITTDIDSIVDTIRANTKVPCAVGFGISNPQQAAEMAKLADGVIVGSAIVEKIGNLGTNSPAAVGEFVESIRKALDSCKDKTALAG